ncbi:MAG: hypothetical protein JWQ73_4243 [Variovorax sp.]|nr:hypothetical protein [Variovorax sp.]
MASIAPHLGRGHVLNKYFAIRRYGAKEAKLLAIAERHKQLQQMTGVRPVHPEEETVRRAPPHVLPTLPPASIDVQAISRSNNLSGIVGVQLHCDRRGVPQAWVATTRLDGRDVSMVFALKKYGDEEALTLAIMARQDQLQQRAKSNAMAGSRR